MVQLIGRITGNATVTELKSGSKVTNFSIAINDSFKSKNGKFNKIMYVSCAYWLNPDMAIHFKKGKLLEVNGRMELAAYNNLQGEPVAKLNFHVSHFKFHGGLPTSKNQSEFSHAEKRDAADNLPF